jgi:hypothetical protein
VSLVRPISLAFGRKAEDTVAAVATTAKLVCSNVRGPQGLRICNRDTVGVAYRFGASTISASLTTDPVLPGGGVEIITVSPDSTGNIYMSIVSEASPTGSKFEATPCEGI